MAFDGLTDAYDNVSMGASTDRYTARLGISREDQDAYGARSHQLAAAAFWWLAAANASCSSRVRS